MHALGTVAWLSLVCTDMCAAFAKIIACSCHVACILHCTMYQDRCQPTESAMPEPALICRNARVQQGLSCKP
jgi:hypothetical protein